MSEIVIDAKGQSLGRVATVAALALQGKTKANYEPSKKDGPRVRITNISGIKFTGRKLTTTFIRWHTGYIGGLKQFSLKELWQRKPEFVVRHAVSGMLPKNLLRPRRLKRLLIER